jgi:hypothetical protein
VAQIVASFDGDRYWELALSDGGGAPLGAPLARWRTTDTAATTHNLASPDPLADPQTDTHWHVLCGLFNAGAGGGLGPDKRLIVDGAVVAEANAHGGASLGSGGVTRFGFIGAGSQADTFNGIVAGAGFFAGDLVELVVYTRALADDERDQLENYFAQRYG